MSDAKHLRDCDEQHVTSVARVDVEDRVEYLASCSCGWRSCPYRSFPRENHELELAREWALSAARVHRLARGS